MMIMKRSVFSLYGFVFVSMMTALFICGVTSTQALTLGKTYDKNNYQEIGDLLIFPLQDSVKNGDFLLKTGELEYELTLDERYLKESRKNEGKYDLTEEGVLVLKDTGKEPEYVYGMTFPVIDSKDPKVGAKIIENFMRTMHYRQGSVEGNGYIRWIGTGGFERQILVHEAFLYYQNRERGPLPNPRNYLVQQLAYVVAPFDLRGVVQMAWTYNSPETDTAFSYVPMLRRVRRVSAATKSDGFAGSDLTLDDANGWSGKNASMTWKLVGEGEVLAPFSSPRKNILRHTPDGAYKRIHPYVTKGYETPGWKGVPWAPVSLTWYPRPVWIVEGVPKDPYYNGGRLTHYVDKDNYTMYFKIVYDNAGEYWKTVYFSGSCSETEDTGVRCFSVHSFYLIANDRRHHATTAEVGEWDGVISKIDLPPDVLDASSFTEASVRQLSK